MIFRVFLISAALSSGAFAQRSTLDAADRNEALKIHNDAREEVGTPPLEFSDELAKSAQAYAEELAKNDTGMVHSKGLKVSENLSIYGSSSPLVVRQLLGEVARRLAVGKSGVRPIGRARNQARASGAENSDRPLHSDGLE
ncbi:MAG: hypothetical protein ACI8UO_002982 [Verrucomicrobiales bacterium]|jgi:hypothetical protein